MTCTSVLLLLLLVFAGAVVCCDFLLLDFEPRSRSNNFIVGYFSTIPIGCMDSAMWLLLCNSVVDVSLSVMLCCLFGVLLFDLCMYQ